MKGNLFRVGNEVFIEGKSIGRFASVDITEERDSLSGRCTMTLPVYAIGFRQGLPPAQRIRAALEGINIKPGARIDIDGWFYNNAQLGQQFERLRIFSGFIRQVIGGFPSKIVCEDYSFILRFGTINRDWVSRTKLKDMVDYLCPISNKAFEDYRKAQGFDNPADFPALSFDSSDSADVEFALQTFKLISPFEALSKLMNMFTLYGTVNTQGKVYFGIGVRDKFKRTVTLATNTNVIGRDIVPTDGLFENYKVVVNALMADGTKYTYEYGDSQGEAHRYFVPANTVSLTEQTAKNIMARLKGTRNKGTIKTVLYPQVNMFDFVEYTDTMLPELTGNYYVIGRNLSCDTSDGFIQTLTVTNEMFIL